MRAWSAWWVLIIFVILEIQKSTPAKLEKFTDDENQDKVDGIYEKNFKCCKNHPNTSYGP